MLAGMQPGGTFIDMSTSTPSMAKKIDATFREKGCNSLDAPVSIGGVFVTVGGDKEVFDRFRPAFEVMHEHVLYMGLAGQGHVAKLCRQYIGFIGSFSVMEALLIAAKAGADMPAMVAFLSDAVGQPAFRDRRLPKALQGDYGTLRRPPASSISSPRTSVWQWSWHERSKHPLASDCRSWKSFSGPWHKAGQNLSGGPASKWWSRRRV